MKAIDADIEMAEDEDSFREELEIPQELTAGYRYVCLEGASNADFLQNNFCRRNDIPPPTSRWDIIDLTDKKLIEVKVMKDKEEAYQSWRAKSEGFEGKTSLCWVDPDTGDYEWNNHDDIPRGMDKVVSFILQRRQVFQDKGILEATRTEERIALFIFGTLYDKFKTQHM